MKLADPIHFCRSASTAPALNRGLAALGLLGEDGSPLSLESLAARLSLPKASLFRLLDTLQNLGLVRQAEDEFFNANGVRRCAVAVFSEPADEFLGVLALAEVCHFSNRPPARSFLPTIADLLNS